MRVRTRTVICFSSERSVTAAADINSTTAATSKTIQPVAEYLTPHRQIFGGRSTFCLVFVLSPSFSSFASFSFFFMHFVVFCLVSLPCSYHHFFRLFFVFFCVSFSFLRFLSRFCPLFAPSCCFRLVFVFLVCFSAFLFFFYFSVF